MERLRTETRSGWFGRQDDVTGFLTELTGGRFTSADGRSPKTLAFELLSRYGDELFGTSSGISFTSAEPVGNGGVALRGEQRIGKVPVLDGALLVTVEKGSPDLVLRSVRGRVFPNLDVETSPSISKAKAVSVAERKAGGKAPRQPRLVIFPLSEGGALSWEVTVVGEFGPLPSVELYYVDAQDGVILSTRPGGAEFATGSSHIGTGRSHQPLAQAENQACGVSGQAVEISGKAPTGEPLRGHGIQLVDGRVALVDTTTPSFRGNAGAICAFDATGISENEGLPGTLATSSSPEISDSETLAALVFGRLVYDYYRTVHGRNSWDGKGGSLVSSVHYGGEDFCNAYFLPDLRQMVYGKGCTLDGVQQAGSFLDVDIAGHEITHGVTETTAHLHYSGQSGALNEGFSDYFGNVIGDRFLGRDSNAAAEGQCQGITPPTEFCTRNPDGTASLRYMLNGAKLTDYLHLLDVPFVLSGVLGIDQDSGGVHRNSAIWNNVLWTMRTLLARIDGKSALQSPRAQLFDKIVYGALTRHLTASAGFLDARAAVEQSARELGADSTTLRVIRQIFDFNGICENCVARVSSQAIPLVTTSGTQLLPSISSGGTAWLDFSGRAASGGANAQAAFSRSAGRARPLTARNETISVAFAGPGHLVTVEGKPQADRIVRYDLSTGATQTIDQGIGDAGLTGVAGSDQGAAWYNAGNDTLNYVDPNGLVSSVPYPADDFPVSIGTGGGTVTTGGNKGSVVAWRVGSDASVLETLSGSVFAADAYVDKVVAVAGEASTQTSVVIFDLNSGQATTVSTNAAPFGVTVSDRYVVWSQVVGELGGAVAKTSGGGLLDNNLFMFSLASGRTYQVVNHQGQQGFPYLNGNQLIWQDSIFGGDDVFTGTLPAGL